MALVQRQLCSYLNIERDVVDTPSAIIQINSEVIKIDPLLQKLSQIMLQEITTRTFLQKLRNCEKPRHLLTLVALDLWNTDSYRYRAHLTELS